MKAKTLITFIDSSISAYNFPCLKAISYEVGLSDMCIKEARNNFYGVCGLSMYQVIITKIEKDDIEFYSSL